MVSRTKIVSRRLIRKRQGVRKERKKEKAEKRLKSIHKQQLQKKIAKRDEKKKAGRQRRREDIEIDEDIVAVPELDFTAEGNDNHMRMLEVLGLLGSESQEWEAVLEQKLQEGSEQSIDNPEVKRVYGEVARIFANYRSGKVPKAFKIIPNLEKWREVLEMCRPEQWTPQAMGQAVAIFTSGLDSVRAELFFRHYLVPAVRRGLQQVRKLNYHYYEALKKAVYKTNAWFKGVLFEFCSPNCTLREIKVIESLLSSMTIPVLSASVAMVKMMELQRCSAITHYLLALVCKGYSLPQRVIDLLVAYLLKFEAEEADLPVVWQQLFLALVKQYSTAIDQMAKAALLHLAHKKKHPAITPEIVKILA